MDSARSLLAALAWLLAASALVASLLAHGGRFSLKLDILTHAAPAYLVAALVAVALSGMAPRGGRAVLAVVSLLGVAAAGALILPEVVSRGRDPRAAADAPGQLKVIQFNAWGRNAKADEAIAWIVAQDPDVVVIEEAGRLRDKLIEQGFHTTCRSCGAVVFSRAKPISTFAEPAREGRPSYLASATFRDARGEFTVAGVHRHWPIRFAKDRAQAESLDAYLRTLPKARLIVAGDFNSTPWSFARRRDDAAFGLIRRTRALPTWPAAKVSHNRLPAPFPYLPIDHVYAGRGWATVNVERGPELGSDHYPVVVTLAPAGPGPR